MKFWRISLTIGATGLLAATAVQATSAAPTAAVMCRGVPATVVGTPQMRQLSGTSGNDVVVTGGAKNVETLGGDDLVCVTGKTETVMAGDGDDRVFTGDLPVRTSTLLEAGSDQFVGGARMDRVVPGPGVDQIDTGGGADTYDDFDVAVSNVAKSDRVSLGPGSDVAVVAHPNLSGVLDGGSGLNTLAPTVCCDDVADAWIFDSGTETATQDGEPWFHWSGFRSFGFGAFSIEGTLVFHGTDAAERVSVGHELEFGPRIELLDMRGGDDQVTLFDAVGPVLTGDGNDSVQFYNVADDRSPSVLDSEISIDLGAGTMRLGGGTPQTFDFTGVENVEVSGFVTVSVRGDEQANNVVVGRACLSRIDGLGGADSIRALADQGCAKRYTVPHSMRADGGSGFDVLIGRQTGDRLIGGPGTDSADGRGDIDTCEAEIQQRCER